MLGERIKEQRKKRGLTQQELGRMTRISQGRLSQLENGELSEIETRRLKALAQALEVSADWLLELDSRQRA